MKKAFLYIISIILILAMLLPLVNFNRSGNREIGETSDSVQINDEQNSGFSLPLDVNSSKNCSISSDYKQEWDIAACETFEDRTGFWVGEQGSTSVYLKNGKYVIEAKEETPDSNGYTVPILVGAANDAMISVESEMDCMSGDCAWGVFVRGTTDAMVYVFMIDNHGSYLLTGLSPEEEVHSLGNIQNATNSVINTSGKNTIVGIAEGKQMMFYVNGALLAAHEAYDSSNPTFGIIAWGSPGARSINTFDNVLVRIKSLSE